MCKLSIIIPCYRIAPWLRQCLDSVLLPDREDYEILPVNDGSPDNCAAIAAEYAQRFPGLVRPLDQENRGLGAARNTGLEAARGEYVLFLDGDDLLAPGALAEMLSFPKEDADVLVFDYDTVNEQGQRLSRIRGTQREGTFSLAQFPSLLLDPPNAWNKLWRRTLFQRSGIRFPARLWYEDLATTPSLYLRAERIRAVRRPWLCYRQRGASILHSRDLSRSAEIIPALDTALDDFYAQGQFGTFGEALEAMAVYHQLLTATARVNRVDPRAPLQRLLLENLESKFPHWRENLLLRSLSGRQRLLLQLIQRRQYALLHGVIAFHDGAKTVSFSLGKVRRL